MTLSEDLVGKSLGSYEILSELGKGGMAVVYKARRRGEDELVALKVLSADFISDERALKRFQREAKTCSSLDHPNIIKIYGIGEDRGFHFFAMEYLPHKSLHDIIKDEGRFAIDQAVELVVKTLSGLQAAHEAGIIHRDLKPENIMMNGTGDPVLVDFGIAKSGKGARLTQTGVLLGTPYYMSPEQITGKEVQRQSDLYSMGVVLYELLTAEVPFQADSTFMITYKHCTEAPPPPRKLNEKISEDLEKVVLRALEKDLAKRYQTATEFAADLARVQQGESVDFEVTRQRDIYSLPEFRKGMDAYKRGEHLEARVAWQQVVDGVPDPEFAAEANRWIATSFFDEQDFLEAFRRYKHTADRWPDTEEARRVPIYLDGCCFQQLQLGEKLLLAEGRAAALDAFEGILEVLDQSGISEAEKQESHWIRLTEERAYKIAEELRIRNLVKGLAVALVLGTLGSAAALGLYFRFVDPFAGHLFAARWAAFRGASEDVVSEYQWALKLKPDNVPTLVRFAEALTWVGKDALATATLRRVLGPVSQGAPLEPGNPKAHELLGDILDRQGQLEPALAAYRQACRVADSPPEVWVKQGRTLGRLARFPEEEAAYLEALKRRRDYPEAYTLLAVNVWRHRRDPAKALQILEEALRLAPRFAPAQYQKGRLLLASKQAGPAEKALLEAVNLEPGMVDAHYQLAVLYTGQGHRDKAVHHLKAADLHATPEHPADRAHYLLGQIHEGMAAEKSGDEAAKLREQAEHYYREAMQARPEVPEYAQRLGLYYLSIGSWEHAVDAFRAWARAAPGDPQARLRIGAALIQADRDAEAVEVLREALALAPGDPELGHQLGRALAGAGDMAGAAAAYDRVLAATPGHLPTLMEAVQLAISQRQPARAAALVPRLEAAAAGSPEAASARALAGRAALAAGDVEGARAQLSAALQLQPELVAALSTLGMLELSRGDVARGRELITRSLALSPTQDGARGLREALQRTGNGR